MKLEDVVNAFDKDLNDVPLDKETVGGELNKILNTVRSHDLAGSDTKLISILFGLCFKAPAEAIVREIIWLDNSVFAFTRILARKKENN